MEGVRKGCLKKPLLRTASPNRLNNCAGEAGGSGAAGIRLTKHNQLKDPEAEKENFNAILRRRPKINMEQTTEVAATRPSSCVVESFQVGISVYLYCIV